MDGLGAMRSQSSSNSTLTSLRTELNGEGKHVLLTPLQKDIRPKGYKENIVPLKSNSVNYTFVHHHHLV